MALDIWIQFGHNPALIWLNIKNNPINIKCLDDEVAMKCIDAVEGTAKCILNALHVAYTKTDLDDSDYIRQAKCVIEATDRYIRQNPELIDDPQLLKQVLYVYSRNLWIMSQQPKKAHRGPADAMGGCENEDYQTYYFDYLYQNGVYPN